MFMTKKHLPRRTFLRGLGATVALPLLDAMLPAGTALAATAGKPQTRYAFLHLPHGAIMGQWTPKTVGKNFDITPILEPFRPYQSYMTVVSNLDHRMATSLTPEEAARSVHLPTILLLFAFMVISAQMRLGGFYAWVTRGVTALAIGPAALLAGVIAVALDLPLGITVEHRTDGQLLVERRDESIDARRLGTLVVLEPNFRAAAHAARITIGPRDARRRSSGDSRGRPFGDRPPQGPTGRGRRLR